MTKQTTSVVDYRRHPCFNPKVKGKCGRVHLPVAPACNIQCNYCNRKYDCVNESRPGVTSTVLTPEQALFYMGKVLEKEPRITVAGIAGPGDPFANADKTLETMQLIRRDFPHILLCLASNGLNLETHVPELAEIGVSHVTVTVNAVDPQISENIYAWVRDGSRVYHGLQGAELLLDRQLGSIKALKKFGITVKINTIVIPGINDHHVMDVAAAMKKLGVDLLNCMAMLPNKDTVFENVTEPGKAEMAALRNQAEQYLPQMRHCTRCRADAVGLLNEDRTEEMRSCLSSCSRLPAYTEAKRPYVAVATQEGVLVNQHLGEAIRFQIWQQDNEGFSLVEERPAPPPGRGGQRWLNMSRILEDCRAVIVSDIGDAPQAALQKMGLRAVIMSGFIEEGLKAVYSGKGIAGLQGRMRKCTTKGVCAGDGGGCG